MHEDKQNINKPINCSLKLIRQAADEKFIKQLAIFHWMKACYGNSVVFDYRQRMNELSEKFGISEKTLYTYFKTLREKELIEEFTGNPNNLHFRSIKAVKRQLCDKKKTVIYLQPTDSIWDVQCRLTAKLIEQHLRKLAFLETLKRFGNHNGHDLGQCESGFRPSFSIRNTAKLLNINEKTATKVIRTLQQLGVIDIEAHTTRKVSESKLPINILADFPGYLFVTDKGTFQTFGQKIILNEFPIKPPKITPNIYANYYKSG